jgi:hypothetical protein
MESGMKGERKRQARKLDAQEREGHTRAKYGARMRPAPVVVKSLATGEVVATHESGKVPKPLSRRQASFIRSLRRELGIEIEALPETALEGMRVIEVLLGHRATNRRLAAKLESLEAPERGVDSGHE